MTDEVMLRDDPRNMIQAEIITEAMRPFMAFMQEVVNQMQAQTNRIEALEKQVRLNTPMTGAQVKYIKAGMKEKATELILDAGGKEKGTINKAARAIKTDVLRQFGAGNISEIPRHEYQACRNYIDSWTNRRLIRKLIENETEA